MAISRRLHSENIEYSAQFIDYECRERFAIHVVRDDEEVLLARLCEFFQERQNVLDSGDLLVSHQDVRIPQDGLHPLRVRYHVGRYVSLVEFHSLDIFIVRLRRLRLLHGHHAVLAHLLDDIGDGLAELFGLGGNRGDLPDLLLAGDRPRHVLQCLDRVLRGFFYTAPHDHRIGSHRDTLEAFVNERFGDNNCRRGSVPRLIVRLRGDFLHDAGAHILEFVGERDLFGNRNAIISYRRAAP